MLECGETGVGDPWMSVLHETLETSEFMITINKSNQVSPTVLATIFTLIKLRRLLVIECKFSDYFHSEVVYHFQLSVGRNSPFTR